MAMLSQQNGLVIPTRRCYPAVVLDNKKLGLLGTGARVDKGTIKRELERLIAEAPKVAPSIADCDGRNYGNVTDEGFDPQNAQRWDLEASSLLQQLAGSNIPAFVRLNGQYFERKAQSANYHSRSIFVHQTVECLRTAIQLLASPIADALLLESVDQTLDAHKEHVPQANLDVPEKVTIPWLIKHVPVTLWITAVGLLVASFALGIQVTKLKIVQEILAICGRSLK